MKRFRRLWLISIASSMAVLAGPALATSWFDFSQSSSLVTITSTNFNNPTPLRRVTVICPANGHLVATAEAGFSLRPPVIPGKGWIRYSITMGPGIDPNHYRNLQDYEPVSSHSSPAGMFRVDRCQAGQQITYRFVAQRVQAVSASAWQPRLVVEFFDIVI